MKKTTFLRFKKPTGNKSVNWIKVPFSVQDDVAAGIPVNIKEDWYEDGLSVFRTDENGEIIIENDCQATTLTAHIFESNDVYEVEGEEIGIGHDGEPLVPENSPFKKAEFDTEKHIKKLVEYLTKRAGKEPVYEEEHDDHYEKVKKLASLGMIDIDEAEEEKSHQLSEKTSGLMTFYTEAKPHTVLSVGNHSYKWSDFELQDRDDMLNELKEKGIIKTKKPVAVEKEYEVMLYNWREKAYMTKKYIALSLEKAQELAKAWVKETNSQFRVCY